MGRDKHEISSLTVFISFVLSAAIILAALALPPIGSILMVAGGMLLMAYSQEVSFRVLGFVIVFIGLMLLIYSIQWDLKYIRGEY